MGGRSIGGVDVRELGISCGAEQGSLAVDCRRSTPLSPAINYIVYETDRLTFTPNTKMSIKWKKCERVCEIPRPVGHRHTESHGITRRPPHSRMPIFQQGYQFLASPSNDFSPSPVFLPVYALKASRIFSQQTFVTNRFSLSSNILDK